MEMRLSAARLKSNEEQEEVLRDSLSVFVGVFGDAALRAALPKILRIRNVEKSYSNIAGVTVPVFSGVNFEHEAYDLFVTEPYYDAAIKAVEEVISLQEARKVLEEQHRLLRRELNTTTQRVNLFEKVKIPETKANIKKITVYLGDQQVAAVVRGKISKKNLERAAQKADKEVSE